MTVKWIEYKGKRILYADFRGQTGKEGLATIELGAKMAAASPTKVLMLSNYEGATATPEWFARAKQLGQEVFDLKVEKDAVVGVTGVKRVLLQSYNMVTKKGVVAFNTEAEALEWLVKD
jgi:hypothetical protein